MSCRSESPKKEAGRWGQPTCSLNGTLKEILTRLGLGGGMNERGRSPTGGVHFVGMESHHQQETVRKGGQWPVVYGKKPLPRTSGESWPDWLRRRQGANHADKEKDRGRRGKDAIGRW